MNHADLELRLRAGNDGRSLVDLQFRGPDGSVGSDLALGRPVAFDLPQLRELALDEAAYGRALAAQLFADPALRLAWATVRGFLQGAGAILRLRLRIDDAAEELHSLRWELLHDPATERPLCRSERVLFSRFLDVDDLSQIAVPASDEISAAVVVASPVDLDRYHLEQIPVAAEIARATQALATIACTTVSPTSERRVTLNQVIETLRGGHAVLYLVCHGRLIDGQPYLWLEHEDGTADCVSGERLAARIADLNPERRPLLIVLASCQSSGHDQGVAVLTALGPRLAKAGIAAVVGIQGNVPLATVGRLMPRLFAALLEDGQIDHALALARADLPDEHPWWMPVLYLRVRDGQIFRRLGSKAGPVTLTALSPDLAALIELLHRTEIQGKLDDFRSVFRIAHAQIDLVGSYKDLHDLFQKLERPFNVIVRARRRFTVDSEIWEELEQPMVEVQAFIQEILERASDPRLAAAMVGGRRQLEQARAELGQAMETLAIPQLERAVGRINSTLKRETSRVNTSLVNSARVLQLEDVAQTLVTIRGRLASELPDTVALRGLTKLIDDLDALDRDLRHQVDEHNQWQAIDDALRMMADSLIGSPSEIRGAWDDLRMLANPLCESVAESWAQTLTAIDRTISEAFATGDLASARRHFITYQTKASQRFHAVDDTLLRVCQRLQETGRRLDLILRTLEKA